MDERHSMARGLTHASWREPMKDVQFDVSNEPEPQLVQTILEGLDEQAFPFAGGPAQPSAISAREGSALIRPRLRGG